VTGARTPASFGAEISIFQKINETGREREGGGREGDTLERAFDCQLDSTPPVEVTRDVHV
jgi:hypothetical protein